MSTKFCALNLRRNQHLQDTGVSRRVRVTTVGVLVSACVGEYMRVLACVGVGARARACAFVRVALLIQHATRMGHIVCGNSSSTIFSDILS
jgi:hypothetical protein